MKSIFCALLIAASVASAQEGEWELPPPPPPEQTLPAEPTPPPPPPVVDDAPQVPPVPPVAPVAPPPAPPAPAAPAEPNVSQARVAPTLHLLMLGFNGGGDPEGWVGAPSLRTGVRVGIFPRSPEPYAWNLGVSAELGLEGLGFVAHSGAQQFGLGLTLKAGANAITRGGLYFPFLDAYVLWTGTVAFPGFVQKLGLGLNFNLLALLSESGDHSSAWRIGSIGGGGGTYAAVALLVVMSILMPSLEVVWTPPNAYAPWSTVEVRFGAGF